MNLTNCIWKLEPILNSVSSQAKYMKIYRTLRPFNALNEDEEPQLVQEGLLLLDEIRFDWVFFYAGTARFSLKQDEFARFTELLG